MSYRRDLSSHSWKIVQGKATGKCLDDLGRNGHFDIVANHALYLATVQGLLTCGRLEKAREIYSEMKSKGFPGNPNLQKLLQEGKVKGVRKSKRNDLQKAASRRSYKGQQSSDTSKT